MPSSRPFLSALTTGTATGTTPSTLNQTWREPLAPALRRFRMSRPAAALRSSLRGACDERRHDVARVAIEVVPSPVVARRRPGVGVAGCDLDVTEWHTGVERGRDEAVAERVGRDPLGDAGPTG